MNSIFDTTRLLLTVGIALVVLWRVYKRERI